MPEGDGCNSDSALPEADDFQRLWAIARSRLSLATLRSRRTGCLWLNTSYVHEWGVHGENLVFVWLVACRVVSEFYQ